MKKFFAILSASLALTASASAQTFTGAGEYVMEDNEIMARARESAYREAMRSIAQQAGVYISGFSQIRDQQLTQDELEMLAATLAKVQSWNSMKELDPNGKILIRVTVTADVDSQKADAMLNEFIDSQKSSKTLDQIQQEFLDGESIYLQLQSQYQKTSRDQAMHLIREGDRLRQSGNLDESLMKYEESISKDSTFAKGFSRRGYIRLKKNQIDQAKTDFEHALSLDAEDSCAHLGLAILFERSGNSQRAAKEYREFLKTADIMEFDKEITIAIEQIVELER